jgi:cohesin loading factor subunit SCC2
LGVRKRVIKLLRAFYGVTDDIKRRTDICTKLVLRMFDEDDTVKDLSIKTLEELWIANTASQPALQKPRTSTQGSDQQDKDKTQLLNKVSVIMGVAASFRDRQSPLEDVLHKIMASKDDADAGQLHARYSEICEALIDGLVDASELPGFVRETPIPLVTRILTIAFRQSSTAFERSTCSVPLIQPFSPVQMRPPCCPTSRMPHL